MSNKLLFIGSVMADIVCPISFFPKPGEGVVSEGAKQAIGGCAFNAANVARQLGADCELFVPLGRGAYAGFLEKELQRRGLSGKQIETDLDCGAAICLVQENGERTMITLPGIERQFQSSWFDGFDASEYSAAYLCGYELDGQGGYAILDFLEANRHMQVYYAPGPVISKVAKDKVDRINQLKAIWHLNDQEAVAYTGRADLVEAGRAIAQQSDNVVVITEGEKGAHIIDGERYSLIPTNPIVPVDTIGAGDSNIGAMMAAVAAGYELDQAVALANKVSAAVCMTYGATFEDEAFLKFGLSLQ